MSFFEIYIYTKTESEMTRSILWFVLGRRGGTVLIKVNTEFERYELSLFVLLRSEVIFQVTENHQE